MKLKRCISKNIHYSRKDSWISHFKTFVRHDFMRLNGISEDDGFKVWRFSIWSGAFYPVVIGNYEIKEGRTLVRLRTKMNVFGQVILLILALFWIYWLVVSVILQNNNEWTFLWKRILISLFLFTLPVLVIWFSYRSEKRKAIREVQNIIQGCRR